MWLFLQEVGVVWTLLIVSLVLEGAWTALTHVNCLVGFGLHSSSRCLSCDLLTCARSYSIDRLIDIGLRWSLLCPSLIDALLRNALWGGSLWPRQRLMNVHVLKVLVVLLDGLGGMDATFFNRFEFERVIDRLQLGVVDVLVKLQLVLQISALLLLSLQSLCQIRQLLGHILDLTVFLVFDQFQLICCCIKLAL